MTATAVSLVEQAVRPLPSFADLRDMYAGYVDRPRAERRRMRDALADIKGGNVLDLRALFSLPESRDERGRPVVAIAGMRWPHVSFYDFGTQRLGATFQYHEDHYLWFRMRSVSIPSRGKHSGRWLRASVPPVPAHIAPKSPRLRAKCFVLFDADWETLPHDPYLLEKLNANEFRILGHWDLTERERELMALMGL